MIAGAAVIFEGDRIAWRGHEGSEPRVLMDAVTDDYDCGGGLVTANRVTPGSRGPSSTVAFASAHSENR